MQQKQKYSKMQIKNNDRDFKNIKRKNENQKKFISKKFDLNNLAQYQEEELLEQLLQVEQIKDQIKQKNYYSVYDTLNLINISYQLSKFALENQQQQIESNFILSQIVNNEKFNQIIQEYFNLKQLAQSMNHQKKIQLNKVFFIFQTYMSLNENFDQIPLDLIVQNLTKYLKIQEDQEIIQILKKFQQLQEIKDQQEFKITQQIVAQNKDNKNKQIDYDKIQIDYKYSDTLISLQEIIENKKNTQIFPLIEKGEYSSVDMYLNNLYYLMREDLYREFRETVHNVMIKGLQQIDQQEMSKIYAYNNVNINSLDFLKKGFQGEANVSIYPHKKNNEILWSKTQRLKNGSLLFFFDQNFENHFFATVFNQIEKKKFKQKEQKSSQRSFIFNIIGKVDLKSIKEILKNQIFIIESKTYYEAYQHFLNKLKKIQVLPFQRHLINVQKQIDFPTYIDQYKLFTINLDQKKDQKIYIKTDDWKQIRKGTLDNSQFEGLKNILTKKISLIQGPPGTGKSFIGSMAIQQLLNNKQLYQRTGKKPILIVCYTNHALDQFLNHIIQYTQQIVRIGGQSKDQNLEKYNIRNIDISKSFDKRITKQFYDNLNKLNEKLSQEIFQIDYVDRIQFENYLNYKFFKEFTEFNDIGFKQQPNVQTEDLVFYLWSQNVDDDEILQNIIHQEVIMFDNTIYFNDNQINKQNIQRYYQFQNQDDIEEFDDFEDQVENQQELIDRKFEVTEQQDLIYHEKKFYFNNLIQQSESYKNQDYWEINHFQRINLINSYFIHKKQKQQQSQEDFQFQIKKYYELKDQLDIQYVNNQVEAITQFDIVGITVTGCAKYNTIIEKLKPPIILVEEAGEVLENQLLTVLHENTQHLILIGDHQQLKPTVQCYELEKRYNYNISLFQRLVNNDIQYIRLNKQRRMRKDIADFIRIFYDDYQDNENVQKYENIKGVSKNVFFFNHKQKELQNENSTSKINMFEAKFIALFVNYLIQQNYEDSQITVLGMYLGQVFEIRKQISEIKKTNKVKVQTVDNYQGEENDIVIISCVRFNDQKKIGFTAQANRINVALSRARLGQYVFGNFDFLRDNNEHWNKIVELAENKKFIGNKLSLSCQKHKKENFVRELADFNKVPLGGCQDICNERKECGHICKKQCHISEHKTNECKEFCQRTFQKCGHKCEKLCGNDCGECQKIVEIKLKCGHIQKEKCSKKQDQIKCMNPCERTKQCGHQCKDSNGICGNDCNDHKCIQKILKFSQYCNHYNMVQCYKKNEQYICQQKCEQNLDCGHKCQGNCYECFQSTLHMQCSFKTNKLQLCGHEVTQECGYPVQICSKKCNRQCCKAKCNRICGQKCIDCLNQCSYDYKCKHNKQNCKLFCKEICNVKSCDERCEKLLKCGHQCIGLCNEKCPQLCRICDKDAQEFQIMFGFEDEEDSLFYQLDCNHIFEVQGLDQFLQTQQQNNGQIVIQQKQCPNCKKIIENSKRYQKIIKQNQNDINQIFQQQFMIDDNDFKNLQILISKIIKEKQFQKKINYFNDLKKITDKKDKLSILQFKTIQNQVNLINIGYKLLEYSQKFQQTYLIFKIQVEQICNQYIFNSEIVISDQQWDKIKLKLQNLEAFRSMADNHSISQIEKSLNIILSSKFNLEKEQLKKIQIGNQLEEIKMVVKVMNMGQGHWFKCSNGHYYCIGECGGAMETSKCPECGENIGGNNHQLNKGQKVATEIDGARISKYDQDIQQFDEFMRQDNIANMNPDDIIRRFNQQR